MRLGVNVDHVATLRQARLARYPDPVLAALACQRAGADSIVAHLREDRRHIQDADVFRLKAALRIKLNLEMATHPSVVRTALAVRPATVTLVPERRQERTTEAGLDAVGGRRKLSALVDRMHARGIDVSFFVDPVPAQIDAAVACGADAVEIHTGAYAEARTAAGARREAERIHRSAQHAIGRQLPTHVGHGLDYANVAPIAAIPGLDEFNIGFSIVAESVFSGLVPAVRKMKSLIRRHAPRVS